MGAWAEISSPIRGSRPTRRPSAKVCASPQTHHAVGPDAPRDRNRAHPRPGSDSDRRDADPPTALESRLACRRCLHLQRCVVPGDSRRVVGARSEAQSRVNGSIGTRRCLFPTRRRPPLCEREAYVTLMKRRKKYICGDVDQALILSGCYTHGRTSLAHQSS